MRSGGHVGPLRPRRPGASSPPPPWPRSGGRVRCAGRPATPPARRAAPGRRGDETGTRAAGRMAAFYIMLCLRFVGPWP
ncbi:hypothetical protein ACRRTK_005623 [Alexandromys fortis]